MVPFHAPTQNPAEPVTTGSPMGAGLGPEVLGLAGDTGSQWQNGTEMIRSLASAPGASPALRYLAMQAGASF